VVLWVWNEGVGMTPEQLARLYEPFNRLGRNASHGEGTGIGLAISRQLIERMGGHIEAESEAGAWARFTVTLRTSTR
jgi:signal transduction histidine kinase